MVSILKQIKIVEYHLAMARRYGPKWKVTVFQYNLKRLRTKQITYEVRAKLREEAA